MIWISSHQKWSFWASAASSSWIVALNLIDITVKPKVSMPICIDLTFTNDDFDLAWYSFEKTLINIFLKSVNKSFHKLLNNFFKQFTFYDLFPKQQQLNLFLIFTCAHTDWQMHFQTPIYFCQWAFFICPGKSIISK